MERERTSVSELLEGMKLVEDVLTQDGQLLIAAGTLITPRLIARLNFYGITYVYIQKAAAAKPSKETSYYKHIEATYEFKRFNYTFKSSVHLLEESIGRILEKQDGEDIVHLVNDVGSLVESSGNSMHLMGMLQCIRSYEDLIYVHSMNVALICYVFADWLHMNKEEKELLIIAALLHDIGKTSIPKDVLSKKEKLTDDEFELIRKHPMEGYNLLRNTGIDDRVKQGILQHHERCDGTGYPYHNVSANICDFAKIIAIADVYDAMTCNRTYRQGICPFIVIDVLEKEGYQKYDPKFLLPFLERISQCYINSKVLLSNGCQGEVIMLNPQQLARPVIKVGDEYVNLAENHYVSIEAVL